MATTIVNSVGGGSNIEDLTDGERFLIGLLGFGISLSIDQGTGTSRINRSNLDFSKISNINVTVNGVQGPTEYQPYGVYVKLFGNVIANNGTHDIVPSYINGPYGVLALDKQFGYNAPNPSVVFNSFTTKDGKVHTKDNLNY